MADWEIEIPGDAPERDPALEAIEARLAASVTSAFKWRCSSDAWCRPRRRGPRAMIAWSVFRKTILYRSLTPLDDHRWVSSGEQRRCLF